MRSGIEIKPEPLNGTKRPKDRMRLIDLVSRFLPWPGREVIQEVADHMHA